MEINEIALRSYSSAVNRMKISENASPELQNSEAFLGLSSEVMEFRNSSEYNPSEHLPGYTHAVEELADIALVCFTELYRRGINVKMVLEEKLLYNETRKD